MKRSLSPQRLAHRSQDSRANPVVDSVGSPIPLPPARRLKKNAGLSLIEVTFAMALFTMICLGVLQAMLQSRRMTEGSVRQASIASLVQGYMEQFKSIKFAADTSNALPSSSTASPGSTAADWESYTGAPSGIPPILPAKGADQASTTIYLVPGAAPTSMPDISTLPATGSPAKHTESVDIDNISSSTDNTVLDMWVWVNDLSGTNVVKCKQIVIVYQWTVKDGARVRYYQDMMRAIRSIVPTD